MIVLVLNVGSSSLKFNIFDMSVKEESLFEGEFGDFKGLQCDLRYCDRTQGEKAVTRDMNCATVEEAVSCVPSILEEFGYHKLDAVGHRIVHGGSYFQNTVLINEENISQLQGVAHLAPLHNPVIIKAIEAARTLWPNVAQVGVFDTAFHRTIPEHAHMYAIPKKWRDIGVRRYGFHGISHRYVGLSVAKALKRPISSLKIISCHLGNGASLCAIKEGVSLDTSMGLTPLEGLVMGTRSGDVDPGLFAYLSRELGLNADQIEQHLNSQGGLKALTGSHDMRDVEQWAAEGDPAAKLAIDVYTYRIRKYIGAYAAAMGGVDVVAFTAGVGENAVLIRQSVCCDFEFLGLQLDEQRNQEIHVRSDEVFQIQSTKSRVKIIVAKSCEQLLIAQEVVSFLHKKT